MLVGWRSQCTNTFNYRYTGKVDILVTYWCERSEPNAPPSWRGDLAGGAVGGRKKERFTFVSFQSRRIQVPPELCTFIKQVLFRAVKYYTDEKTLAGYLANLLILIFFLFAILRTAQLLSYDYNKRIQWEMTMRCGQNTDVSAFRLNQSM